MMLGSAAAHRLAGEVPTQARDILSRKAPPPDAVLRYGPGRDHIADLRFPAARRPGRDGHADRVPLVIFIHGGFWRAAYDRAHTGPLAVALAAEGFAVCTPEFRRIGQPEGGWPGTFDDVAAAVDALPALIAAHPGLIDGPDEHPGGRPGSRTTGGHISGLGPGQPHGLGPVAVAGHSAGGHLALWAAARHRLPAGSPWLASRPGCAGVVALAAVSDLVSGYQRRLGNGAVAELLGGSPARQTARYAQTDPAVLVPTGIPAELVHGRDDEIVPCELSAEYAARARAAGDEVTYRVLPGAGHFDVIDPLSAAWPQVLNAFRAVVGSRPQGNGPD